MIIMFRSGNHSEQNPLPERRSTMRFPIIVPIRYKVFHQHELVGEGIGETINVASRGLLFHADHPLEPGLSLELDMELPALPDGSGLVKLRARGQIVRIEDDQVAVRVRRAEYRRASE